MSYRRNPFIAVLTDKVNVLGIIVWLVGMVISQFDWWGFIITIVGVTILFGHAFIQYRRIQKEWKKLMEQKPSNCEKNTKKE